MLCYVMYVTHAVHSMAFRNGALLSISLFNFSNEKLWSCSLDGDHKQLGRF
jgi:hypothetical protein